jgi:predicted ATP-binding protein involved in virulence
MKLEHLKLENFRGFRSFAISFDPSFTVLLGGNMAGKTAVLDGAAVGLGRILPIGSKSNGETLHREIEDDVICQIVADIGGVPDLQRQFPVIVEVCVIMGSSGGEPLKWRVSRDEEAAGWAPLHLSPFALEMFRAPDLPVIAQYGTQRIWRGKKAAEDLRGVGSRYDGYTDCFDIASTHGLLVGWMRKQTLVQLQRGGSYVQPQLAAVEAAVKSCIDGVTRFWFDVQYDELRLERIGGDIQSFAMLSEGVRNMVAMVADIAWRTAVLNPQHGPEAHLRTEGVVLIDELDLHLHPAWQRRIVGDLRRTFPKIQFIVTTHSPQIVASVSRAQVRLLDNNRLVAEEPHVEGRDSNAILEDVFGVPSRPETVQEEIDALYRLIEDENFAAARERLAALQKRLGPDDAAMVRARWILDTEEAQPIPHPSTPP